MKVAYIFNRMPVVNVRNLYTVSVIACMDNSSVTDVHSNMADITGTPVEY